jgi:hypothetical protein
MGHLAQAQPLEAFRGDRSVGCPDQCCAAVGTVRRPSLGLTMIAIFNQLLG